ncbi:MAG: hypothetical protein JWL61_3911, partial [Gemmatimonadetes bacterium]|nr:hypothetical protein [Gemmatimonadota bacterium]
MLLDFRAVTDGVLDGLVSAVVAAHA